jgi:hypothetical protein
MKRRVVISLLILFAGLYLVSGGYSQTSITNDGSAPDGSAMLDVKSTTRGFLMPRMTEAQKNAIASPATGLTVYQTDGITGLYYNSGTSVSPFWLIVGNNAGQWKNGFSGIYYDGGKVGIGVADPVHELEINGRQSINCQFNYSFLFFNANLGAVGANSGISWYHNYSSPRSYLYFSEADSVLGISADFNYGLRTDVSIKNTGNVGIGTRKPTALLHVNDIVPGTNAVFGNNINHWYSSTSVNIGDTNGHAVLYIGQSQSKKRSNLLVLWFFT